MEDVLANDIDTHHSRTPAGKPPRKRRVSAFSRRKVDHAYYWMAVPAAVIFAVFLYVPFVRGIMYSFTNSQGYGSCNWIGFQNYFACSATNGSATPICSHSSSPSPSPCSST